MYIRGTTSLQKYKVITSRRFRIYNGFTLLTDYDSSSFIDNYTTVSHDYSPKTRIMHVIFPMANTKVSITRRLGAWFCGAGCSGSGSRVRVGRSGGCFAARLEEVVE